ncbi:MAG: hypothetical protein H6891_03215 [Brucellaceae bacterium]|nr:hypothetical protein [Brucellaceae bacterium]
MKAGSDPFAPARKKLAHSTSGETASMIIQPARLPIIGPHLRLTWRPNGAVTNSWMGTSASPRTIQTMTISWKSCALMAR